MFRFFGGTKITNILSSATNFATCFLFLLCVSNYQPSYSQQQVFQLKIIESDTSAIKIQQHKTFKDTFTDTTKRAQELKRILSYLHNSGYLTASYDSIIVANNTLTTAYLRYGNLYKWINLSIDSAHLDIIRKSGIRLNQFSSKPFNYNTFTLTNNKILDYLQDTGYPFCSTQLTAIQIAGDSITANLLINKGALVLVDSIIVKGNLRIKPFYILRYLNISKRSFYSESKILKINQSLNNLPFVEQVKPLEVEFLSKPNNTKASTADIYLFLNNKPANSFTGILGLLPNEKLSRKILLTGELNLHLLNAFSHGENIKFEWKKFDVATQRLNLQFEQPYIFKTQFGVDASLNVLKKDTSYLTTRISAGAAYLLNESNYAQLFTTRTISAPLYKQTDQTQLLGYGAAKTTLAGIKIRYELLDYRLNPHKGISIMGEVANGIKKSSATTFRQAELLAKISFYQPITSTLVAKLQSNSGLLICDKLYTNELFKLGGFGTIRGFDEDVLLASKYSIFTLETIYIFDQNSDLFAFYDFGWFTNGATAASVNHTASGLGLGIEFETKPGILSLTYAIGKLDSANLTLKNAKIHISFVSFF